MVIRCTIDCWNLIKEHFDPLAVGIKQRRRAIRIVPFVLPQDASVREVSESFAVGEKVDRTISKIARQGVPVRFPFGVRVNVCQSTNCFIIGNAHGCIVRMHHDCVGAVEVSDPILVGLARH